MNPRIAAIVQPHLDRAAELQAQRVEQAKRNRELMPWTAGIVDELREFFPGAKVVRASENGITVGP